MSHNNMQEMKNGSDDMATLSSCMNTVVKQGYIDNFEVENGKLQSPSTGKGYDSREVEIDNFYRFEGNSNPADNAVLYAMKTNDGTKGIIVDAYGTYSNNELNKFLKEVQEIHKDTL